MVNYKNISIKILFTVVVMTFVYAPALKYEEIQEAYYTSYDLEGKQKYPKAIEALAPVVKAYPNGYTINYRLGWLHYLKGNYKNALSHYQKALRQYPYSLDVSGSICLLYNALEDWPNLEATALKMLKVDYLQSQGNYWYIFALKKQKKYTTAEKAVRNMLVYYPTSTSFLYELGEVLYLTKKYQEAHSIFSDIIILDPYHQGAKAYLKSMKKQSEKGK